MSIGNSNKESVKKNNHSWQRKMLNNTASSTSLLSAILAELIKDFDFEIKCVRDTVTGIVYIMRIQKDETNGNITVDYIDATGAVVVPPNLGDLVVCDASAVLTLILNELIDQGLTLDDIELNTDNLEALLTAIDNVLDNSLLELQAINVNTDQLEALSTDIRNLLVTIDADTGNIATSVAALELCCQATNTLLTTIDTVLDQIQTNTLNTVNELTSANVTLAAVENELIALNNTASTLATEATLELVRLQLVALNATDFATETTLSGLLTAFNAEDFATETTLQSVLTELQAINIDTNGLSQEATQLLVLAAINSVISNTTGLATELTLNALLTAFNAEDFATETTLLAIKLQTDQMSFDVNSALEVSLPTGVQPSTYQVISGIGSIVIPAGKTSISCLSYGTGNCTVDTGFGPVNLASGVGLDFAAEPGKTLGSITFAGTIASSRLAITTVG